MINDTEWSMHNWSSPRNLYEKVYEYQNSYTDEENKYVAHQLPYQTIIKDVSVDKNYFNKPVIVQDVEFESFAELEEKIARTLQKENNKTQQNEFDASLRFSNENIYDIKTENDAQYFEVEENIKTNKVKRTHQCKLCNYKSKHKCNVVNHINGVHNHIREFNCPFCEHKSARKFHMQTHISKKHPNIKRPAKTFTTKIEASGSTAVKVKKSTSAKAKMPVSILEKSTSTKEHVSSKAKISKPTKIPKAKNSNISHIKKNTDSKIFQCNVCSQVLTSIASLERHKDEVHNKIRPFKCKRCPYAFSRESNLKAHSEKCCKRLSAKLKNRRKDMVLKTVKFINKAGKQVEYQKYYSSKLKKLANEKGQFLCKVCDVRFHTKSEFVKHNRSEHPKAKCKECKFQCTDLIQLTQHMRLIHKNNVNYACNHCKFESETKIELRKHVYLLHKNEQFFECNFCNYTVSKKGSLLRHFKTIHQKLQLSLNSDEEIKTVGEHHCMLCDYKTEKKGLLTNHMETIHQKFQCKLCNFETSRARFLIPHIQKVHEKYLALQRGSKVVDTNGPGIEIPAYSNLDIFNCIMCDFETQDQQLLRNHMDFDHAPKV